jgi:DNA-binding NarL/FixJ family response regulator
MITKTVFVISNHLMFKRGLESLLGQRHGLNIIVSDEINRMQAVEQIRALQPDIVILDSTGSRDDYSLELINILSATPRIKVISLNLNSNQLLFYQLEQRSVTDLQDLIDFLDYDPPVPTPANPL